ncbi:glycerol-3-phosphate 1-O-acyltransferase PlsY [Allosphingosinicella flava]|uniref:Glycerol-3-phosphate acyltransferase n=1 Tax=Allosphingosinicella flava TaxID=2771430 RepID=A0A7T2GKC2_9SPHN|nr:glycerol-3-phosphate 1-O-acyltransferase PlsY [Sphingosinicella flava]QPQ55454.1 glycerol-3-phosphate 1-O-acyltransferase PlsY [Sphingosinicella flava]
MLTPDIAVLPILSFLIGYALGSIPFGIILTKATGAGDLRSIGSGNIGATNVLRTGRKGLAAATLILDMLKATAAILIVHYLLPGHEGVAAIGALIGHLYPVWLKFRGGKGVATFLGILIAMAPLAALIFAGVWIGALLLTRYSSVGGMSASLSAPIAVLFLDGNVPLAMLFLGFALLVVWKHRDNIVRLLQGTESKVGRKTNG